MAEAFHFRALEPRDRPQLKAAHHELFPIDYEDRFFTLACGRHTDIFSVAAFSGEREELVGFAIGRSLPVSKIDRAERVRLGISETVWEPLYASYVLTLGVVKKWQKRGVATKLISQFEDRAHSRASQLIFLHVITYNHAAIHLYQKSDYVCRTRIHSFYHIRSGRQPEPRKSKWDAFLFVKWFMKPDEILELEQSARQMRTCTGWSTCFPFNAKKVFSEWFGEIEGLWPLSVASSGVPLTDSSSLFHRLFYRRK